MINFLANRYENNKAKVWEFEPERTLRLQVRTIEELGEICRYLCAQHEKLTMITYGSEFAATVQSFQRWEEIADRFLVVRNWARTVLHANDRGENLPGILYRYRSKRESNPSLLDCYTEYWVIMCLKTSLMLKYDQFSGNIVLTCLFRDTKSMAILDEIEAAYHQTLLQQSQPPAWQTEQTQI